jgi:nucleotide-binding universal stress UspA family protein
MVNRILLAVDGSVHSAKALDLAVTLAKATGSALRIVYVTTDQPLTEPEQRLAETEYAVEVGGAVGSLGQLMEPELLRTGGGGLVRASRDIGAAVRRVLGEQILRRAAADAESKGVAKVTTTVESGDPATAILREADRAKPDLLLLGSRGLGDVRGLLLGSVSHKVAHMAPCTVVTVK